MLNQNDLDQIEDIVDRKVGDKTSGLPTKDDFFKSMDEVMGELKTIREEQALISHRVTDHEDRITDLETKRQVSLN